MRLRLKSKYGSKTVTVPDDSMPFNEFLALIEQPSELNNNDESLKIISVKNGFPPKPIQCDDMTGSIESNGIKDGEQLIVEFGTDSESESLKNTPSTPAESAATRSIQKQPDPNIPSVYIKEIDKFLILRNIPDDNSCLFNAISYAINGPNSFKDNEMSSPKFLRSIIDSYIKSNPNTYNEIILGRSPEDYCKWIVKKDSWGGAIELGIFADWFNIRINCLDIESGNFIKFENELKKPKDFIILIYSGIHYDLLSLNSVLSNDQSDKYNDETLWQIDSKIHDILINHSKELCKLLQSKNYSTNTTTFRVRCLNCYKILIGETGATKHANETGHFNFGEVKE